MTCFETEKDNTHHISTIPINQIGFIDAKHLSITALLQRNIVSAHSPRPLCRSASACFKPNIPKKDSNLKFTGILNISKIYINYHSY